MTALDLKFYKHITDDEVRPVVAGGPEETALLAETVQGASYLRLTSSGHSEEVAAAQGTHLWVDTGIAFTYDPDTDTVDVAALNLTVGGEAVGGSSFAHLTEDADPAILAVWSDFYFLASADGTFDPPYSAIGPEGTIYTQTDATHFANVSANGGISVYGPDPAVDTALFGGLHTDVQNRFAITVGGDHAWGGGADPVDTTLKRSAAGVLAFTDVLEGAETSDPSAPAANKGRLYFKDIGGKTALVARFPTGAVQQVSVEP